MYYNCIPSILSTTYPMFAENLWKYIHRTKYIREDEQIMLNYALQRLGMRWRNTTDVENICSVRSPWRSYRPLNTVVFSQEHFCRGCCGDALEHNYYLLHPVSDFEKKSDAIKGLHGWFLKDNWREMVSSPLEGKLWLKNVSSLSNS